LPGPAHFAAIAAELARLGGSRCAPQPQLQLSGGSISACYRWSADRGALFVKVAAAATLDAFQAEAEGLEEIARTGTVRVPRVVASGSAAGRSFLALEWLEAGPRSSASARSLGEALAALHEVTAPRYGFRRDNTIGATPQRNAWADDWPEFFRDRRLRPQLELAVVGGNAQLLAAPGERLLEALPQLLSGHRPVASLLHGDLWGGNWMALASGEPVVFDVASYYGDAETDLAMTRLFGGFADSFYRGYEARRPAAAGAAPRGELYNLYHVLNHANLFGGGYARQARTMIERLLAQLR
jgi:fructosamine-3-kinase